MFLQSEKCQILGFWWHRLLCLSTRACVSFSAWETCLKKNEFAWDKVHTLSGHQYQTINWNSSLVFRKFWSVLDTRKWCWLVSAFICSRDFITSNWLRVDEDFHTLSLSSFSWPGQLSSNVWRREPGTLPPSAGCTAGHKSRGRWNDHGRPKGA